MSDDKKPPSQFTEKQKEQQKLPQGVIILTDKDLNVIKVVEEFTHDGVDYRATPGLVSSLVLKMSKDMEMQTIAMSVVQHLLNMDINVSSPMQGTMQLKFPQFLSNMIVDILMRRIEESKLKSKIVLPGRPH